MKALLAIGMLVLCACTLKTGGVTELYDVTKPDGQAVERIKIYRDVGRSEITFNDPARKVTRRLACEYEAAHLLSHCLEATP